jgi:DDE superfamily endonuclease
VARLADARYPHHPDPGRSASRHPAAGRLDVIAYRATLDVPRELIWFVAKLLLAERHRRGTPRGSRALTCFWQAVLGLRWFRDRTMPDALARDHRISRATAYRYLDEVITVLAEQAPDLGEALKRAIDAGFSHVILDGKIIECDRCKEPAVSVKGEAIDLWYSGKAHTHGGNIQAVLAPDGAPLWISDVEPGSVHDITAARCHALPALYRAAAAGLPTLADPGYEGAGIGILIPVKQPPGGRELDVDTRARNAIQRSLRCLGERGFALLIGRWRALQHITASPSKIGSITRAALVLTHFEHGYIT